MKKTPGIIILIVWFVWSVFKDLDYLIRSTGTTDYYIFSSNGLAPLFFIFAAGAFLLDAAALFYLFRPRPAGFYAALASLALSVVHSFVGMGLTLADLKGVREAYAAGRAARGLPVREQNLDIMFTPVMVGVLLAGILLLIAVMAFLVIRNRNYFFQLKTAR